MTRRLFLCFLLFAAGAASAQHKLGEILDKGAKPMTAEEVRLLVSGAKVSGVTASGASFENAYAADGKISGMITGMKGPSPTGGTWLINERGQLCSEMVVQRTGQGAKACVFVLKTGAEYYFSPSTDDREANAMRRNVSK